MPNSRIHDHLVASRFRVEIEGVTQGAFTAVGGLESTTDVIEYIDGSDGTVRKRPGRTRYANIVLKRGVLMNSELWNWYSSVASGKIERKAGSVVVLGDDQSEKYRYNFYEAWPCRWKSLDLDGESERTLVEELELAVERIDRA